MPMAAAGLMHLVKRGEARITIRKTLAPWGRSRALKGPPLSSNWWPAGQAAALCLMLVSKYNDTDKQKKTWSIIPWQGLATQGTTPPGR